MKRHLTRHALAAAVATLCLQAAAAGAADDIKVGHLTYQTGEYGSFGDFFDAVTDFSLSVINENPPLGRTLSVTHEDIGTVGEERAARRLIDDENIDVLLNSAHDYLNYRQSVVDDIANGRQLLLPSVHGGAIDASYGGNAAEPLFRGAPMDTAIGIAAVLHAANLGKSSISIVSSDIAGAQLQKEATILAAEKLDIEIADTIDFHAGTADFDDIAGQIGAFMPDAVIVFAPPNEGGQLLKAGADQGDSWFVVGGNEFSDPAFVEAASFEALQQHESVTFTGFAHTDDAAWAFYKDAAESSPQASVIGDVGNSYAIQYYDLLVTSALAIEKAGSTDPKEWTAAMYSVTDSKGEQVHTYADGMAALRAGKDINYDGVTGTMEYSDTGVVAGTIGIFGWDTADTVKSVTLTDGNQVLALAED